MGSVGPWQEVVTVSGTGTSIAGANIFTETNIRGYLRAVTVRNNVGSGATAVVNLVFVHNRGSLASLTAIPPREYTLTKIDGFTLTAHATNSSLATTIDDPQAFSNGFAVIVSVTAAGAWTLTFGLDLSEVEGRMR